MPLPKTGVEFVSKGFDDFIRNIGEAAKTITSLGRMTENRLAALRELNDILATGGDAAKKFADSASASMNQAAGDTEDSADRIMKSMGMIAGSFAIAERKMGSLFKGITTAGSIGGMIGGVIGTALGPGVGNALGAAVGSIVAMAAQLQINIYKALFNLFNSIIKNITSFLPKTIGKIVSAGIEIGKALWDFGEKIVKSAWSVIKTVGGAIKSLLGTIFNLITFGATGGSGGGWHKLGNTIFSSMFKFEVLKQVIRGVINEIKGLASESFNAAVDLQTLTIRLDNLIAMQVRGIGTTKDYAVSIQRAIPYTKELLKWIQEMALSTPVSVDDVSKTVSLSIAMGWGVQSAKELTKAILDYTVGMGLGSEITERIIYNFAQMRQQGKVTGTELRDLGRGAFMPVNDILKLMYDRLGDTSKSFEQFREEAAAGTVGVEQFFDAFIEFVETNLPDAAYKMNYTFEAVKQNINDLFKVLLGWNVLGPMIKSITEPIQNLVNRFKTEEMLAKANAIGKAFAYIIETAKTGFVFIRRAFERIAEAMNLPTLSVENVVKSLVKLGLMVFKIEHAIGKFLTTLIPFAKKVGDDMGGTFDKMGDDFFSWAVNLIYNFAKGLMVGASKFITTAMRYIANLLTGWLRGHSPPKILPEIDKWGMDTINEWLHGFTLGDFSILSSLKDSVKDALGALVDLGVLTEIAASDQYLHLSVALIEAMDELNRTGQISAKIFDELRSITGVYGEEIAELLELQLQYAAELKKMETYELAVAEATKFAEKAQRAYDDAVKATLVSTARTNKLVREYNNMLRKGADKTQLKNKLKLINASAMELAMNRRSEANKKQILDTAEEQLKVAKSELDMFKESLKPLEDRIKLQEELIDQLVDLAQAQKDLAEKTGGAGSEMETLTEAVENLSDGLGELGGAGFEIDFDALKAEAEAEFAELWSTIEADWKQTLWDNFSSPNSEFQIALSSLKTAWSGATAEFKTMWDTFAKAVKLPSWDEISAAWGEGGTLIEKFTNVLGLFGESVNAEDGGVMGKLAEIAGYVFNGLKNKLVAVFSDTKNQQAIKDAFNNFMTWVTNLILGAETGGGPGRGRDKQQEGGEVTPWQERLGTAMIEGIKTAMRNAIPEIDWGQILTDIGVWLMKASANLASAPGDLGRAIIEGILKGAREDLELTGETETMSWKDKIIQFIRQALDAESPAKVMLPIGADIIQGMYDGVVAAITDKWNTVKGGFDTLMTKVKDFFGIGSASKLFDTDIGIPIIEGMYDGIVSAVKDLWATAKSGFATFISNVKEYFGIGTGMWQSSPMYQIGVSIINGIKEGIKSGFYSLKALLHRIGIEIPDIFAETTETDSPSKVFMRMGRDLMLGLEQGISGSAGIVKKAMVNTMGGYAMTPGYSMSAPMSAQPVHVGASMTFGDVNISGPMDFALFKALVQKAIIEG